MDPIPMLDGHFTADGAGFAVTDVAGQVHLYATGAPVAATHVPYDQFFIPELRPLPPPEPVEGEEPPAPPREPPPFRPHTCAPPPRPADCSGRREALCPRP